MSQGVHWKSKIRAVHTKLVARDAKGGEDAELVELWERINNANIPLWYLQLLGEPEKTGYFVKKGAIGGSLTKRWFVLCGTLLFYFSNSQTEARAKGVVPLSGAEIVGDYTIDAKEASKYTKKAEKGGFSLGQCWAVKTRMREFVFSCESVAERQEWVDACIANSSLPVQEAQHRKLLWTAEQVRKELESSVGARSASPKNAAGGGTDKSPRAAQPGPSLKRIPTADDGPQKSHSQDASQESPRRSPRPGEPTSRPNAPSFPVDDDDEGGTLNGWKYDDGMLKTYDVKTDGSWPFVDDEKGLFINCQYSWNGSKLRPREGSGSKGDWNNNRFKWSCFPLGQFHPLFEYTYDEDKKRFTPVDNTEIPVWEFASGVFRNVNAVGGFKDITVDGSVPPPIMLAVAMHSWQWRQEGLITTQGMKEDDE